MFIIKNAVFNQCAIEEILSFDYLRNEFPIPRRPSGQDLWHHNQTWHGDHLERPRRLRRRVVTSITGAAAIRRARSTSHDD
jgi:hypothetical protein